jgi:hypothetical protein
MVIFHMHNCVWIFWFNARNIENIFKSQNEFQWTIKHVFWQNYFLHMWPTSKAIHFEPIEHNFFIKWLKKWVFCLAILSFKISRLQKICLIWVFHQVHPMNICFHRRGMLLLYKKFEINCMTLYICFDSFFKNVL